MDDREQAGQEPEAEIKDLEPRDEAEEVRGGKSRPYEPPPPPPSGPVPMPYPNT